MPNELVILASVTWSTLLMVPYAGLQSIRGLAVMPG
jgi:hypothetical protein